MVIFRILQRFLAVIVLPLLLSTAVHAEPQPWQSAPDGQGEFLVAPPQATPPVFYSGNSVTGTALGLVATDKQGSRIVSATYGRSARPVAVVQNLLWVEEIGQGLIALGPNFRVAEKRPTVRGHCIAARPDGFWCLDADSYLIAYHEQVASLTLMQYDAMGRRVHGWTTDGKSLPLGNIYWAAVDANAIWVAIEGIPTHDGVFSGPLPGPIVRIDRTSGQISPVPVDVGGWSVPTFVNTPKQILWTNGTDHGKLIIRSLDKATLAVSTAAHLPVPQSYYAASDGKRLWVFPNGVPRVFSLPGYHEIAPDKAGPPPPGSPEATHLLNGLGPRLLAASGHTAWFRFSGSRLLGLTDTGDSVKRLIADTPPHPLPPQWRGYPAWYGASAGNDLYLLTPKGLTHYSLGTAQTHFWIVPAAEDIFYPYLFAVTNSRVWLQASQYAPIRSYSRDLSQVSSVLFPDGTPPTVRDFVAARDGLYFWSNNMNNPGCWRIDANGIQISALTSWRNLFPKMVSGSDLAGTTTETDYAYGLPEDGFLAQFGTSRPDFGLASVMHYDPVADQWTTANQPLVSDVFSVGTQLYGYQPGRILYWQSNHWREWATLPLPDWRGGRTDSLEKAGWILAATERYLYVSTPLGVYRIAWSQLRPVPSH